MRTSRVAYSPVYSHLFMLVVATGALSLQPTFAASPVAEYLFSNNLNDTSGSGFNGTGNNTPTFSADRFGNASSALQLNGVNQSVSVADNATLDFAGGNFSISVWVNVTNPSANVSYRLVSKRNNFADANGYEMEYNPSTNLLSLNAGIGGAGGQLQITIQDLPAGWHHFAGTVQGTVLRLYVNGVEQTGSPATRTGPVAANAFVMNIGAAADGSEPLDGAIDDVRLYNVVLTQSEILSLFVESDPLVKTWTGLGADDLWTTAANWSPGVPVAGDKLVFAGNTRLTPVNDFPPGTVFHSVTIADSGFDISSQAGSTLEVSSGIKLLSGASTISSTVLLSGAGIRSLESSSGATLTLSGVISGTGGLQLMGGGNTVLAAASTFSSTTTLLSGTVTVARDTVPLTGTPTTGPFGTGTLQISGGAIQADSVARTFSNTVLMLANMTVSGTQDLTFTGSVQMNNASRTIIVNSTSAKGAIFANGTNPATDTAGAIVRGPAASGNRALTKAGPGQMTVQGIMRYSDGGAGGGQFLVTAGTVLLEGSLGKLANGTSGPDVRIDANATLILDNTTVPVAGGVNGRIDDGDQVQLNGAIARLNIIGNAAASFTETIGTLNINVGGGIVTNSVDGFNCHLSAGNITNANGNAFNFTRQTTGAGIPRLLTGQINGTNVVDEQGIPFATVTGPAVGIVDYPAKYDTTTPDGIVSAISGISYTSIASGNWDGPVWSPAGVPGANDAVNIDASHVITLNGNRSINTVRFISNGQIVGANTLTVSGGINSVSTNGSPLISCNVAVGTVGQLPISSSGTSGALHISGVISGANGYVKLNNGRLQLSGANTCGSSAVNGGTLVVTNSASLCGAANAFTMNAGTLEIPALASLNLPNPLSLGGATINAFNDVVFSGNVTLIGNPTTGGTSQITFSGTSLSLNNATRTFTTNNPLTTISASIINGAGNQQFQKSGTGELVLSGNNTHSAANSTQLNAGTLTLSSATAAGTGILNLNGGTLKSTIATIASNIDVNGNFTYAGPVDLTLSGAAVRLTASRTITINSGLTVTLTQGLKQSAAAQLDKNGAGTFVFSGPNTFATGLRVNAGAVRLNNTSTFVNFTATPAIAIAAGATLELDNTGNSIERIDGSDQVQLNGGTVILRANSGVNITESIGSFAINSGDSTIRCISAGAAAGSASFSTTTAGLPAQTGSATFNFERQSDPAGALSGLFFSGVADGTPVPYGTVNGAVSTYSTVFGLIPAANRFTVANGDWNNAATWNDPGTPSVPLATDNVIVRHNVTLTQNETANSVSFDTANITGVSISGGFTLTVTSGLIGAAGTAAATVNSAINVPGAAAITVSQNSSADLTLNGAISNGTGVGLIKLGLGKLVLGGTNTFAGVAPATAVAIRTGTLQVSADANFGNAANGISLEGGTLQASASFTAARVLTFAIANSNVSVDANQTLVLGSAITGNVLFNKIGAGTLAFAANSTRNSTTEILAGSIRADTASGFGNAGTINVRSGAVLEISAGIAMGDAPANVNLFDGSTVRGLGNNSRINADALTVQTGATVLFENTSESATDTMIIGNADNDLEGGTNASTLIRVRAGAGRIQFNNSSSFYEGRWNLETGTILCTNDNSLGDNNPAVYATVNAGVTLGINTNQLNVALILNGGTVIPVNGDRNIANPVVVAAPSTIQLTDFGVTARSLNLNGVLYGSAALDVTGNGGSAKVLNLANSGNFYSGTITINSLAAVRGTNVGSTGAASFIINSGGALDLRANGPGNNAELIYGNNVQASGGITINCQNSGANSNNTITLGKLTSNSAALTVTGANGYQLNFASGATLAGDTVLDNAVRVSLPAVDGPGALAKSGVAVLTFNGAATYAGATTVNAGSIILNGSTGSIQSPAITVNSGAEFIIDNSGTAADYDRIPAATNVTLNGGTFTLQAPNNVNRTETIGALAFGAGNSTINILPNASGNGNCELTVLGDPTFNANALVTFNRAFTGTATSKWLINPEPADGTAFNKVLVIEPGSVGPGSYSTGNGIITQAIGGRVYTSIASGDWNDPLIWISSPAGGTFPGAADIAVISAGHSIALTADESALAVRFAANGFALTSAITGAFTLTADTVQIDPPAAGAGTGLRGDYYNDIGFNNLVSTRLDPQINNQALPATVTPQDNYSIVWSGYIKPEFDDVYSMSMAIDDGVRFYFDGDLIGDSWTGQGITPYGTTRLLRGNTLYPVRIEFYQGAGLDDYILQWSSASQTGGATVAIPAANLLPADGAVSIANLNLGTGGKIIHNGSGPLNVASLSGNTAAIYGTGVINLTGAGTISGETQLNSGFLQVGNAGALGTSTLRILGGSIAASTALTLPNSIIADGDFLIGHTGRNLTLSGSMLLTGNRKIYVTSNSSVGNAQGGVTTISGVISDGGNGYSFSRASTGVLTLSNANTYGGATNILSGTLRLGANNALPTTTFVNITGVPSTGNINNGTLDLQTFRQTIGGLSLSATAVPANSFVTGGANSVLTINSTSPSTFTGLITGAVALVKDGPSTFTIAGGTLNTYTGNNTINNGTLILGLSNSISGNMTINPNGILDINNLVETVGVLNMTGGVINTGTGILSTNNNGAITSSGATPAIINGNFDLGNANRTFVVTSGGGIPADWVINASVISTGGGIIKTGSGSVELNGVSTYTGPTQFTSGSLLLGPAASIANSSSITLSAATLEVEASGASNPDRIGDSAPISMTNSTFRMISPLDVTRTETVGLITLAAGSNTIELTATGLGASQLTMNDAAALPARVGIANLSFLRTNSGGATANLFFTSGVNGTAPSFAAVNGNPSIYNGNGIAGQGLIDNSGASRFTVADGDWNNAATWNDPGGGATVPAATANVIVRHAVTMAAPNTCNALSFDNGTPSITSASALTVSSGVITATGSVAPLIACALNFNSQDGLLNLGNSGLTTIAGDISSTSANGLIKSGAGTLTLTGATSTYTPSTTILGGTLSMAADTATAANGLLGPSANTVVIAGGTYLATGTYSSSRTFSTSATSLINTIDIASGQTLTLSSAITGSSPLFVNDGAAVAGSAGGTLAMTAVALTRTGTTTLNGGTARVALFTTATSSTHSCLGNASITVNDAALELASAAAANERFPNALVMNNKAVLRGTGIGQTSSGTSGAISIASGANVAFETGTLATDVFRMFTAANQLSGGGGGATITISGAGRVHFMQDNNGLGFTGNYIVNSGIFAVNNSTSLSATANTVTINPGSEFTSNSNLTIPHSFILNGGMLAVNNSPTNYTGAISVTAASTLNTVGLTGSAPNPLTISGQLSGSADLSLLGGGSSITLTNPLSPYSGTINMGANSTSLFLSPTGSPASSGPPANINWTGTLATLNLRSNSSTNYSASATLNFSGTINVDRQSAGSGQTLSLAGLAIASRTLTVTGGNSFGLNIAGGTALTGNATFNNTTAPLTLTGVMDDGPGSFSVNKTGASTLTLLGDNTYEGDTTTSGGTLLVNNTTGSGTGSGNVVVNNSTLGGTGRIAGAVSLAVAGATINPGVTTGVLTLDNGITSIAATNYSMRLDGTAAGQFDQVAVTNGTITLGSANLNITGTAVTALNDSIKIIDNATASPISGTFNNLPEDTRLILNGRLLEIAYDGGDGNDVTLTDVGAVSNTVTVSPTTLATVENGSAQTFRVVLNSIPTANVVISLSSSDTGEGTVSASTLTFTAANALRWQTVTVTPVDDKLDDGAITYNIPISVSAGSAAEYIGFDPADVSVTNGDDDAANITVSPLAITTSEAGGTATFTVSLATRPLAPVTINLTGNALEGSFPASITFTPAPDPTEMAVPADIVVTVTGVDDDLDDGDVNYTLALAVDAGSSAEYLTIDPADVSVTNTDDDTAGVTVSQTTITTAEAGAAVTFTVVLDSEPYGDVTINLTGGDVTEGTYAPATLTFTAADWDTPQTVTITPVNDDVDDGDQSYTITTAAVSAGDAAYEGIAVADVSVTNTDDDTVAVVISSTTIETTEGGANATFTVILGSEPVGDVVVTLTGGDSTEGTYSPSTLTFTPADWDTAQTVTITPVNDDIDDGDISYTIVTTTTSVLDPLYNNLATADISVTNKDDADTFGITLSTATLTTTEGGANATFTVVLDSEPLGDVVVTLTGGDSTEGTYSPATLTFTAADWDTAQTVTVTPVNDDIDDGNVSYTIVTTVTSVLDPQYNNFALSDISVTNNDDGDTAGVTVSPTTLTSTEGGANVTFTVVLDSEPLGDVVVTLTGGDSTEGTYSPSTLTFTAADWDTAQTVTIVPVNDDIDDGNVGYTITTTTNSVLDPLYDNIATADVSVTNNDDGDTFGITLSTTTLATTEGGTPVTFTVVLNSEPLGDVVVALSGGDSTEGTYSPATLTFTAADWDTPQTVTVTPVNDSIDDGDVGYTIVTAVTSVLDPQYDNMILSDISVTNQDDTDAAGITVSPLTLTTTEAGASATFTVTLQSRPVSDVTINLTGDSTEGSFPASITFTPPADPTELAIPAAITVTVTGLNDDLDDGDITYTLALAVDAATSSNEYDAINPADVSVTNTDDDTAGVTVSQNTLTTTEGGADVTFTIVLNSEPFADVTINLTGGDTTEGTYSPSTLTFTAADWDQSQTVTVTPVNDDIDDGDVSYTITTTAVSAGDAAYQGIAVADVTVTNQDDADTVGVVVSPTTLTTIEGGAAVTFTVVLTSEPLGDVVIALTGGDTTEGTFSPSALTFTAADWDTAQTVTVTPVNDDIDDGNASYTIVTTASSTADAQYDGIAVADVSLTNQDDADTVGVTLSTNTLNTIENGAPATLTVVLDSEPLNDVTITLSGGDSTEGTYSPTTLTFTSADWDQPQTVTVTPVDDLIDDGSISYTIVTAATSADSLYDGIAVADVSVTNDDDADAAGVTVTPTTLTTTEGQAPATFTVVLNSEPVADVVISLGSSNTAEGTVSPATLTFTAADFNVPQTVTVTPGTDLLVDGNIAYTIGTTATSTDPLYDGIAVADVAVTNVDDPPPSVGSAITFSPLIVTVGVPVTFTVPATDPGGQPLTVTFNYGDGTIDTTGTHVYTTPQTYVVTITVSDGTNNIVNTLTLTAYAASSGDADPDADGTPNSIDGDDDNDGFYDELEVALGSSPTDGTSRPFASPTAGTPGPLTIAKMSIKLNFAKPNLDGLQISGTLPVPAGFVVAGQQVGVDVGGVIKSFTLDAKGKSPKANNTFQMKVVAKKGVVAAQNAKYKVKFSKGSFAAAFADENLISSFRKNFPVNVTVNFVFNKQLLQKVQSQMYSSTLGKSGKTK